MGDKIFYIQMQKYPEGRKFFLALRDWTNPYENPYYHNIREVSAAEALELLRSREVVDLHDLIGRKELKE